VTSQTLRTVGALIAQDLASPDDRANLESVAAKFSVAITPAMATLIDKSNPADPIARQFVPHPDELHIAPEELPDPIADHPHSPIKGIIHRYPDRVLFLPTHTCAVYCRFCFRREKVGAGSDTLTESEMLAAFAYVRARPQIWEIILSGGDPFILPPRRLAWIMSELATIPHLAIIRFHTRIPVANPAAINDALIAALNSEKMVWVVIHTNHAKELTTEAKQAITKLRRAGIPLLSQSVLLKGINDTTETLEALFRTLVSIGVKPYYLHHADLTQGTAHFRTTIAHGQSLTKSLRGPLSGLCHPTYVLDLPGGQGKVPVSHPYAKPTTDLENWQVEDTEGNIHNYP
jgi:lysine 2,3-aminomutase